jgi:hypothetical protein
MTAVPMLPPMVRARVLMLVATLLWDGGTVARIALVMAADARPMPMPIRETAVSTCHAAL